MDQAKRAAASSWRSTLSSGTEVQAEEKNEPPSKIKRPMEVDNPPDHQVKEAQQKDNQDRYCGGVTVVL